ncbi:hypothetical protein [Bordetella trematum]|uniref:hypothetical protein n=1 Tax=Bordetella trematum TaxID=123899 RepID=UPI003AF3EB67
MVGQQGMIAVFQCLTQCVCIFPVGLDESLHDALRQRGIALSQLVQLLRREAQGPDRCRRLLAYGRRAGRACGRQPGQTVAQGVHAERLEQASIHARLTAALGLFGFGPRPSPPG